ncbi:MAG: hypothetical protein KAS32_19705 [Candidatus Peribacteraceae bacterium]|nr:hypothetical protein [Candidatus Peribacteraceae bacterium]
MRLINKVNTLMDDDAKEPVGKPARTSKSLSGQIYFQDQTWESGREGILDKTLGYVVFRVYDLGLANVTIRVGDHITAMGVNAGQVSLPLYVYRFRYRAHHPDQGGYTLLKAWFTDRKPAKQ